MSHISHNLPHLKLWESSKYVKHEGINKKEASSTKHFSFSLVKLFQKDNLNNALFPVFPFAEFVGQSIRKNALLFSIICAFTYP